MNNVSFLEADIRLYKKKNQTDSPLLTKLCS